MPPPKKAQDQPSTEVNKALEDARSTLESEGILPKPVDGGELYRFTSIGCLYRLRKLPSQPMLPERIILERRTSHLHEKEEWDVEWRQQ